MGLRAAALVSLVAAAGCCGPTPDPLWRWASAPPTADEKDELVAKLRLEVDAASQRAHAAEERAERLGEEWRWASTPPTADEQRELVKKLRLEVDAASQRAHVAEDRAERLAAIAKNADGRTVELVDAYRETRKALKEKETTLVLIFDTLERHRLSIGSLGPPVPAIEARVLAVELKVRPTLLILSAGANQKVEKGFHFSVYRGTEFVAKVVVEKVLADACGARVLFTKAGLSVIPGDEAKTRLQ